MEPGLRLRGGAAVVLLLLASCTRNAVAPPSPETLQRYVTARELYAERRFDQALDLLERNQAGAAGFAGNSFLIGKIHFFREDYARAQRAWEQTLADNPHHLDSRIRDILADRVEGDGRLEAHAPARRFDNPPCAP